MSFFAILFALLIEQVRPLGRQHWLHGAARAWADWAARNLDAGKPHHGWIAWGVVVGAPALGVLAVHWLLDYFLGFAVAVLWNVAVLYATLGFRAKSSPGTPYCATAPPSCTSPRPATPSPAAA